MFLNILQFFCRDRKENVEGSGMGGNIALVSCCEDGERFELLISSILLLLPPTDLLNSPPFSFNLYVVYKKCGMRNRKFV
jgi:hypothetical protein